MHVIIGGFGRVGRHLAHSLEGAGHSVTVVDRNPHVFAEHGEEIRGRKLTGEVFDRETLLKAGIERADAFAAVTSGDNSNIVSARVARERFNVGCVVARIFDPRRAAIYERFGIPTVSSVQWASAQLLATILEPGVRTHAVYGDGDVVTVEASVPLRLTGKRIADVEYPGKFTISALVRGGKAVLPQARMELVKGDRLYVTAARGALDELKALLTLEEVQS